MLDAIKGPFPMDKSQFESAYCHRHKYKMHFKPPVSSSKFNISVALIHLLILIHVNHIPRATHKQCYWCYCHYVSQLSYKDNEIEKSMSFIEEQFSMEYQNESHHFPQLLFATCELGPIHSCYSYQSVCERAWNKKLRILGICHRSLFWNEYIKPAKHSVWINID